MTLRMMGIEIRTWLPKPFVMEASSYVVPSGAPALVRFFANVAHRIGFNVWVCSGASDQVEINAAAVTGREVLLEGTFNIDDSILRPSNTTLEGQGPGTIIRIQDNTNAEFDVITNSDHVGGNTNIVVRNLKIDGNKANQSRVAGAWNDAIWFEKLSYGLIENVEAGNCLGKEGIGFTGSNHVTVANCYSHDNANGLDTCSGGYFNLSQYCLITGCIFKSNENIGLDCYFLSYSRIIGNTCESNIYGDISHVGESNAIVGNFCKGGGGGIYCSTTKYSVVVGNVCIEQYSYGISIYGTAVTHTLVANNVCYKNNMDGINIYHADDCIIIGNFVYENGQYTDNAYDNIKLDGNASHNSIWGNICRMSGTSPRPRYGIRINSANCQNNIVKDNDLYNSGQSGAFSDAGTDTELPEIFIPYPVPNGNIGAHQALVLTDGADITGRFEVPVPMELVRLVRAQAIVVPGGTGNMRRSISTNFGKIGTTELYNTHTDTIAAGEVAVTINRLMAIDIIEAFTDVAAGDLVGVEFTREGSHANDTVNANCYLIGFRMQYV